MNRNRDSIRRKSGDGQAAFASLMLIVCLLLLVNGPGLPLMISNAGYRQVGERKDPEAVRAMISSFSKAARQLCRFDDMPPQAAVRDDYNPIAGEHEASIAICSVVRVDPLSAYLSLPWLLNLPPPIS